MSDLTPQNTSQFPLKQEKGFTYLEAGEGEPLVLLHGLFGALSNWTDVVATFGQAHRVLIPVMPVYEESPHPHSPEGFAQYIRDFTEMKQLSDMTLIGNSLGGHVGLVYTLMFPEAVARLVLTGSSGLFEAGMGSGLPRRGDYAYIQERVEFTFYHPATATKELVDEVFGLVNDPRKAIQIVKIARSAQRMNMREDIQKIQTPTCLIWGLNDNITPPYVAHEFHRLLPNSELNFIDHCGHAPMMEQPQRFNEILAGFLKRTYHQAA